LSLLFNTEFSSARQFQNRIELFSSFLDESRERQTYVSLRMNPVALRDQSKPIRSGENLLVNYNETYDHHILLGKSEMED